MRKETPRAVQVGQLDRQTLARATTRAVKEIVWHHRAGVLPGFEICHVGPVLEVEARTLGGDAAATRDFCDEVLALLALPDRNLSDILDDVWACCNRCLAAATEHEQIIAPETRRVRQVAAVAKALGL